MSISNTYLHCKTCNKIFQDKTTLDEHVENCFIKLRCQKCRLSFKARETFDKHMDSHSKNKQFATCKICNKAFKYESQLKVHSVWHNDDKTVDCSMCQASFKTKEGKTPQLIIKR